MPINVTCPSCLKRFTVSDKFAGKTGPCPNCQKTIQVPELTEQVVIHTPESAGPKDSAGKAILSPIKRQETKVALPILIAACVAALAALVIAVGMRVTGQPPQALVLVLGCVLLAPPLVFVGYWFLHDDELEGYRGQELFLRSGLCAGAFALLWGMYVYVPTIVVDEYSSTADYSGLVLALAIPVMLGLGALVAVAAFELEILQGVMHYSLYFIVTFLLAWTAGAPLAKPLSGGDGTKKPAVNSSSDENQQETKPDIPKVLQ